MVKLGSHVSMNGKKMLLGSSEEAASYEANTFMIYTGAPQNTRRKPIEELNIEKGQEHMEAHGMEDIVVHAPYIINLANTTKPATFELGVDFLKNEIERTILLSSTQLIIHIGFHVISRTIKIYLRIIKCLYKILIKVKEL